MLCSPASTALSSPPTFPWRPNTAVLTGRLTGRDIETRWVTPGYVEYIFDRPLRGDPLRLPGVPKDKTQQ
jgi:hypothetical protein